MKLMLGVLVGSVLLAGCGSGSARPALSSNPTVTTTAPTTTSEAPTTTTAPIAATTTTVCVPVDTTAQQNYVDTVKGAVRQTEGAIAQIQLVIDNGIRDRASTLRYQTTVQADYDHAAVTFDILGTDTAREKMTREANRLADAKDIVASWDATLAKARGDLGRAQAQKAEFEKKVRDVTAQIAASQEAC